MSVYTNADIQRIVTSLANGLLAAMTAGNVPASFAGGYLAALDSVALAVGCETRFLLDQFGSVPVEPLVPGHLSCTTSTGPKDRGRYDPPRIGTRSTCSSRLADMLDYSR